MNTRQIPEIQITVNGGYSPEAVRVAKGAPVRLVFNRQEKSACSQDVVIAGLGIRRPLAPFAQTAVEFTPEQTGVFPFTCGMNMLRGQIEVEG